MPRPRRPVLAAICAVLLLATATAYVRGIRSWDIAIASIGRRAMVVTLTRGSLALEVAAMPSGLPPWDWNAGDDSGAWNWWQVYWDQRPAGGFLSFPLWFAATAPGAGLWWSWRRGRNAGAGFPVEASIAGK